MTDQPSLGATLYPNGGDGAAATPGTSATAGGDNPPATTVVGDPPAGDPAAPAGEANPAPAGDPTPADDKGILTADETPTPPEPTTYTVESYSELQLPEGLTVDQPMFDKFKGLAAELSVSPEAAGKLLALQKEFQESQQTMMAKAIAEQNQRWAAELNTIPELSGDNRAKAQEVIGRAIAEFGTPKVREVLSAYGLQNNPDLARFIYSMAEAVVEGDADPAGGVVANGRQGRPRGQTLGQLLYGDDDQATQ